jgi:zinc transport system substrate-binding protein
MKIVYLLLLIPFYLYGDPSIVVSIAPQKFFVSKITGNNDNIEILIPQGSSPATYSPKPSKLRSIKQADIYFTIGVPFEKNWLERFKSINPNLKIVDTTKGIKKLGKDPHVWLDPSLVAIIAKNITESLIKANPKKSDIYRQNYEKFKKELSNIDKRLKEITKKIKQKSFIVYHPSFGYFAKAYGLKQIAIEHEGKSPTLKYLSKIVNYAKKHHIKTIFISPEFSQKEAKFIASKIGAKVEIVNHLSENWDTNILKMAKSFEKAD